MLNTWNRCFREHILAGLFRPCVTRNLGAKWMNQCPTAHRVEEKKPVMVVGEDLVSGEGK